MFVSPGNEASKERTCVEVNGSTNAHDAFGPVSKRASHGSKDVLVLPGVPGKSFDPLKVMSGLLLYRPTC